ncbi:hypothetical protein ASPVEDRAFT_55133 [Aspergillus versicolor CBS 583.65]|uniref:Zn(2)-C6 fungal-type domain-containing protein n=1 Tax=Aspergillus versicolor CBS 583.65 TaxID=1036611 RepID=A0A1L9PUA4_ASPVE|nr:uncharacterized protein ASPVEDRAFT_55133 [Aspergillus versicolor CBS 583.65]OJJ05140.1 hypothetical protein ASPVEDRAFT_55133 [Aspergillus versicolor CBS 583.65]
MRSPHGCSNCRRSKVKCDEQKPTCTRCWKKDLQCSSPVQLRWESAYCDRGVAFGRSGVWGKSPPKKGQGQGQGQKDSFPKDTTWLATPAIQPWSFVNSDTPFIQRLLEEEDDHAKRHLLPAFDAKVAIGEQGRGLISSPRSIDIDKGFTTLPSSPGLFPSLDVVGNRLLFDYYINQICPRTGHGPMSQSPFASVILPYCISAPPTVLRAIQALAACHWSQYDQQYTNISLRLKSRVLVDFRKQISSNRKALVSKDPELLVIAMFLCLFDIVDHCDQQWIVHLQGAKDIIRLRKKQQLLIDSSESTQQDEVSSFVELFFAFQDVMGRTACAKADLFGSSYWRQDDMKINPWMGCSPALVSILFSVMDLSRSRRDMVSDEDQMTFSIRANALNNKLTRLQQDNCDRGQDQTIQRVAELKKLACIVFLNCALFGGRPSDPVIKSYIHKTLQEIVELLDLEPSCHVIWPLFVAAVELDPLDVDLRLRPDAPSMDGRRLIFELLEKMAKSSVSSVSRTRVVIEQVWKARDFSLSNSSEPKRPSISEANDWEQYVVPISNALSLV